MVEAPAVLLLSLALAGCAAAPQASFTADPSFRPARYAWDGAGEDPNQPRAAAPARGTVRSAGSAERSRAEASHAPNSREWWQAQDGIEAGIEASDDARVNRALVICRGCVSKPPQSEDARLAKASD
jgi:hypothetical protein